MLLIIILALTLTALVFHYTYTINRVETFMELLDGSSLDIPAIRAKVAYYNRTKDSMVFKLFESVLNKVEVYVIGFYMTPFTPVVIGDEEAFKSIIYSFEEDLNEFY